MNWQKPKPIGSYLNDFSPDKMSPGLRRGFVLRIWKAKTAEVLGRKDFSDHIKKAYLTGEYENPVLVIVTDNSAWKYQLHMNSNKILSAINRRCNSNFIQKVIIK